LTQVLSSKHLDTPLALGYMLSLPVKEAFSTFKRAIPAANSNFARIQTLARIGMDVARAWQNPDLLHQCTELERNSHWWHMLTSLQIPFDHRRFQQPAQDNFNYQRELVPLLLEVTGGDLGLTLEFCEHYKIEEAYPSLLFVEQQLLQRPASPQDNAYQTSLYQVLPQVHDHYLVKVLR
ncbi:unnamed protein product, partial [Chrysoparadoxa australica]